jgi:hypothetical protein
MHWWSLFLPAVALAASPDFRVERTPVPGGAELLTVFGHLSAKAAVPDQEVPLVSVLRDTLGDDDPANDRLRYIWVLTSARPSVLQHAAAALPFFYWRPDLGKRADSRPVPILDMGNTSRSVWTNLLVRITQIAALDGNGALLRSSTRRYWDNLADQRRVRLIEGMSVLSRLEDVPAPAADPVRPSLLGEPDLLAIQARLALAGQTLGGLVNSDKLPDAYRKQRTRTEETRGHNWELLRQRAEANGLYFEPMGLGISRTHAVLWVAQEDLGTQRPFDGRYLNIAEPYMDARLKNWKGLAIQAHFDAENRRVPEPVEGGATRELIPLALYSLEYPKVPLLVADFRATGAPKRREMVRRAATDIVSGVLGVSKWGNWPYFAGSWTWDFIESRHGATRNRVARLESAWQTRRWLALDQTLDRALREELLRRVEVLGVNPLNQSVFHDAEVAQRQYAALLRYAQNPGGLSARLERDRNAEMTVYHHGVRGRAGLQLARMFTLGVYRHKEPRPDTIEAALDHERKARKAPEILDAGGGE